MSIVDLLKEHEDRLLAKITFLEEKVKSLTSEKKKLEDKIVFQHTGLINLLLNRFPTPDGLKFHDGIIERSFQDDLRMFVIHSIEKRENGLKSIDEEGYKIPYIPLPGRMHMLLDKEADFPNVGSSIQPTIEDARIYCEKRDVWIKALLIELRKIML